MSDSSFPVLKNPKIETLTDEDEEEQEISPAGGGSSNRVDDELKKKEDEVLALLEYRTKEVQHLRRRITHYKAELEAAEQRLEETQNKLANVRARRRDRTKVVKTPIGNGISGVKFERRSTSPSKISEGAKSSRSNEFEREKASPLRRTKFSSENVPHSKPLLVIPPVEPNISQPMKNTETGPRVSVSSLGSRPNLPSPSRTTGIVRMKEDQSRRKSPERKVIESKGKGMKRKLDMKEHKELIPLVNSRSLPSMIRCQTSCISSQHKRKLRSLILCPPNDQLFATSALDGVVNLWQVQGRGSSANLLSTTDCLSAKQRRWPEDIAWHPQGDRLFSVYSADGGDSQISILNLNKTKERERVTFLEEKPHVKGIINNIVFMPWDDTCFVTGGSDHSVFHWTEQGGEDSWKPKAVHRSMHSSAVMGVAGMQQKKLVLSVGADKRIVGFDLDSARVEYKHQIDSKCMSVLPNPCDFNLFMVQTGTPGRQLRLFDIRLRQTEIHAFGWKQESSESQSALINQAWSPDGLYITSGSADPVIHIFDIRYNSHKPSQSIKAHQKRVFKAVWHHTLPLMISISSDLNIGLHKIL